MRTVRLALTTSFLISAATAQAGTPIEVEFTCPIGGEEFTHIETASLTTWGSRPDGKPYGSWIFPSPLPECPSNKLVLYRDFAEEELEILAALIASPQYTALHGDTPYYRASWLAKRMDTKPEERFYSLWLLMRAGWQADPLTERRARYLREFAKRAEAIALAVNNLDSLFLRYRAGNAWRELGEFERARTAISSLRKTQLDVTVPDRGSASQKARDDAQAKRYLFEQIDPMLALIDAQNTSAEPITMIPEREAGWRCFEMEEEGKSPLPEACSKGGIAETLEYARAAKREDEKGEAQSPDPADDCPEDSACAAAGSADAVSAAAEALLAEPISETSPP
ncbi:MAG: hypothetical protein AAF559_07420 [Pseudomonadota bacterium]